MNPNVTRTRVVQPVNRTDHSLLHSFESGDTGRDAISIGELNCITGHAAGVIQHESDIRLLPR
ncbi:hypothetical protein D3C79_865460 [compost metagenome]